MIKDGAQLTGPINFRLIKNKLNNFITPKKHDTSEFGTAKSCEKIIKIIKHIVLKKIKFGCIITLDYFEK